MLSKALEGDTGIPMLNVFHISDLHYTNDESGQLKDATRASVKSILNLAETLRENGTLGPQVCVMITGDIVQSGSSATPDKASDYAAVDDALLRPLMKILNIGPDRIFIVPGNHEVDRGAVQESNWLRQGQYPTQKICEADLHNDLRSKLHTYFTFIDANGYQSVTSGSPRIAFFNLQDQQIVCLNGLVGSYSRQGYGDKGELYVLDTELSNDFGQIQKNAVVLTHHPLSWFADSCAENLKEFLSARGCRLMTGHIHDKGVQWVETKRGGFAHVKAGVSAEVGTPNQVAVAWLPQSNSVAVRHYAMDLREGGFTETPAHETEVSPERSREFFERTEAFFDPKIVRLAAEKAATIDHEELKAASGKDPAIFVPPDVSYYPADRFSGRRSTLQDLMKDSKNRVISGDELSGKSSLLHYIAYRLNSDLTSIHSRIAIVLDYRMLQAGHNLDDIVIKKLAGMSLTKVQAIYLLTVGKIELIIDNFDPDQSSSLSDFQDFFSRFNLIRWTIATRGDQQYMPAQAPAAFPKEGISYYQITETTLPTVMKMIQGHKFGQSHEKPRAIVEQVFRSINNLRAPRTIFYVNSMVDVFLSDASVEPLNRYLLIENLLSDRIRSAYKKAVPNQPVDMDMLETFIGQIAYRLMQKSHPYLSKGDFYTLVEDFVDRKGIQKKRFDADTILSVLTNSFVLRDYEFGYGFMMLSVEDYFLAKHMGKDSSFRSFIMSAEGLLSYPSVAEYYVAQNPSDTPRIEQIFSVIDDFTAELAPVMREINDSAREVIRSARPGAALDLQGDLLKKLSDIEGNHGSTALVVGDARPLGRNKRLKFASEERGAVYLQLGASVLGVTRTLDQSERIQIFKRLKPIFLTIMNSLPVVAEHLASGGEIRYRGFNIKTDYVGELAIPENRFYLILRSMMFSSLRNFGVWSGSSSFFNAAVQLRKGEQDEIVKSALYAQNIEADLSESLSFIPEIITEVDSLIVKEILLQLYIESMTLVPLDRSEEARALERLVDVTIDINPLPSRDEAKLNNHRTKLRNAYSEKLGLNAYIGRLVKSRSKGSKPAK